MIVEIEGKLPTLNELLNWKAPRGSKYSKQKKYWTGFCAMQLQNQIKRELITPVRLDFWWHLGSKGNDLDNVAAGGSKVILDGMVQAGILKSDNCNNVAVLWHTFVISSQNLVEIQITESAQNT